MRAVLVVPALLTLGAPLAELPALGRLAGLAGAPVATRDGLAPALVSAAGLPAGTAPAPLAARGAGWPRASGDLQYADPITLVAGRDDVLFAGRADDLTHDESDALIALLNAHFAADGLAFAAPRPDAWFVASQGIPLPETTALAALDEALASALPRGPEAKRWRRWLSEAQMLLHEHPVNVAREAAGRAPVTGVWLWGGGAVAPLPSAVGVAVYAADGRDADVARGVAANALPLPANFSALDLERDALVVLPPIATTDALPALDRDWLAPLAAALHDGTVHDALLVADDGRVAYTWHAQRPSAWQRLRARFASPRFALPGAAS